MLSKNFTLFLFKELNSNIPEHRRIYFKTVTNIHYIEFKKKDKSIKSRRKRMLKISENKKFIGWIPPTEKLIRKLKLILLNNIEDAR